MIKNLDQKPKSPEEFLEIVRKHPQEVVKLIAAAVKDPSEDFIQDCFVRLLSSWVYQYDRSFNVSISTTIYNLVRPAYLNFTKKKFKIHKYEKGYAKFKKRATNLSYKESHPDSFDDIIHNLDNYGKELLRDKFVNELSHQEISAKHNMSLAAVYADVDKYMDFLERENNVGK